MLELGFAGAGFAWMRTMISLRIQNDHRKYMRRLADRAEWDGVAP